MSRTSYRSVLIVAESKNFSDLAYQSPEGETQEFDLGDNDKAVEEMMSSLQASTMLFNLLSHFDDKCKIILLYQILREAGYNLNHDDCAKTLSISREYYMLLLRQVRKRAAKIIQFQGD